MIRRRFLKLRCASVLLGSRSIVTCNARLGRVGVFVGICLACLTVQRTSAPAQSDPSISQELAGFALGADVSQLSVMREHGIVYRNSAGEPANPLAVLKNHGFNWVREQLLVHPDGVGPLQNDLAYDVKLAKEIKAQHLHILVDMFYSDTWANPGQQLTPAAWSGLQHDQLVDKLRDYNREVIRAFRDQDVMPDMVEVGNEITNGMMWPDGQVSALKPDAAQWKRLGDLLKAAIEGVRKGAGTERTPFIMIHINSGGDKATSVAFFHQLEQQNVPFDVIGVSDYPWWSGTLPELRENLQALALIFHKPIIVVETSFPWAPQSMEMEGKILSPTESEREILHFPATPAGQAAYARAIVKIVKDTPDHLGDGLFYWAAEWLLPSNKWNAPAWGNDWTHRALFDTDGKPLPAMTAFGEAAGHLPQ